MPKKAAKKSVAKSPKKTASSSKKRSSARARRVSGAETINVEVMPHHEEGMVSLLVSGTKLVAAKLWEHREAVIGIVGTVIGELIAQKAVRAARRPRIG